MDLPSALFLFWYLKTSNSLVLENSFMLLSESRMSPENAESEKETVVLGQDPQPLIPALAGSQTLKTGENRGGWG